MTIDPETQKRLDRITKRFLELSPDAQEILTEDIEKFTRGSAEHGPLHIERGDLLQHLLEEVTDARYYVRMEILRQRRAGG